MSDAISKRIAAKRKEIEDLLATEAERLPAVEAFLETAKKIEGVDTADLEKMLAQAKAVLKAANIKVPKPTEGK